MKLINMKKGLEYSLGALTQKGVLDVERAAVKFDIQIPNTMEEIIADDTSNSKLQMLIEKALSNGEETLFVKEDTIKFGPSVTKPEKIICIGLNYQKHAAETNMPTPTSPVLFSKFNNALSGHREEIDLPIMAKKIDYEVELVIVMGKIAKNIKPEDALSYVYGYSVGNDLSARDLQLKTSQWLLGKTSDGFAPLGPYLVTADEIENPNNLSLETRINGERRQFSNTSDMVFNCAQIISYISQHMTLKPGDLIFTGTPEGVTMGYPESEQIWLKSGDEITVSVEKLGELTTILK